MNIPLLNFCILSYATQAIFLLVAASFVAFFLFSFFSYCFPFSFLADNRKAVSERNSSIALTATRLHFDETPL